MRLPHSLSVYHVAARLSGCAQELYIRVSFFWPHPRDPLEGPSWGLPVVSRSFPVGRLEKVSGAAD